MSARKDYREKVILLLRKNGVLRPRDLDACGIPRMVLHRLYQDGYVDKIARGLYRLSGGQVSEHCSLAEISKKIPHGVICLLSSLHYHDLTTQLPFQIWVAIDRKAHMTIIKDIPVRFVRFSGKALTEGVEKHRIDGVTVQIYNPAKTVADCFKYRNKIGLDVALEAMKECLGNRKCDNDSLWLYAKICRVGNVMRPFLEAFNA
ncbi:MAG: transcriptional regulator [Desulforudis sp.]|jgi:predicted transcriptional regulator of viral defense system|nr:MAG: transcriptional regulator [Desulforudis sp.]